MQLDKALKSRKSVRRFKSKKPDWRDIIECIDAARHAPMAGGAYTLKFIVVDDKEKIQKIAEACQQDFISAAPYVVVVCNMSSRTIKAFGERGKRYCHQQAGSAGENFMLKAVEKGLGTCLVGHFADEQIKNILDIPENVDVEIIFPVGYEIGKRSVKDKIDMDSILYFDRYNNKKMKNPKKITSA